MWYKVKGDVPRDDGVAVGSRAVLVLAVLFLAGCILQAALTVVDRLETPLSSPGTAVTVSRTD